jgi:hypothetical protein
MKSSRESDTMMKYFQANIWWTEKGRSYPRVKYYEAETKKEVVTMIKKECKNYREILIIEGISPSTQSTES